MTQIANFFRIFNNLLVYLFIFLKLSNFLSSPTYGGEEDLKLLLGHWTFSHKCHLLLFIVDVWCWIFSMYATESDTVNFMVINFVVKHERAMKVWTGRGQQKNHGKITLHNLWTIPKANSNQIGTKVSRFGHKVDWEFFANPTDIAIHNSRDHDLLFQILSLKKSCNRKLAKWTIFNSLLILIGSH